jgi:hypothetical protein
MISIALARLTKVSTALQSLSPVSGARSTRKYSFFFCGVTPASQNTLMINAKQQNKSYNLQHKK